MIQSTLMQGVLYINYKGQGWSEKYYLPQTTYPEGVTAFNLLCRWRTVIMTAGCSIVWARVSFVGSPRESMAAITAPLGPLIGANDPDPAAREVNDPDTSIHFRFETANGRVSNRLWRGLGDDWIKDFTLDPTLFVLPVPAVLPALDPATAVVELTRGWLKIVKENTVHARKIVGPPATYDLTPFENVIYRGTTSRKTGHPFSLSAGRAKSHS